jgi:NADH:ubiquinone oxidoreductase subunit E
MEQHSSKEEPLVPLLYYVQEIERYAKLELIYLISTIINIPISSTHETTDDAIVEKILDREFSPDCILKFVIFKFC